MSDEFAKIAAWHRLETLGTFASRIAAGDACFDADGVARHVY